MGERTAGRLLRLATGGVFIWTLCESARFLYLGVLFSQPREAPWLAAGTVICLPLQLVLVRGAIRGARPRHWWWLLASLTLLIAVTLPFGAGINMVLAFWASSGIVLLYFRPWWSFVLFLGLIATVVALILLGLGSWAGALLSPSGSETRLQVATFSAMDVTWGGVALAVLVWLVRTIRELEGARQLLAARAVIAERRRIDDEVNQTVGIALEGIIATGEQAVGLVQARDRDAAAQELRKLTGRSRAALAEARRMLTGYRQVSAEAELRAVITLLEAGGIRAHLTLSGTELPAKLPDQFRARLRALVADALSDQDVTGALVLMITDPSGRLAAELRQPNPVARERAS